ncbi:hypothetical protein RF55_15000 [Lasius niger]|uniref:Myb/SANT-like DNA-binding domain-containing protein n=1 Tax=Lasius niger TaxID=67767 RepID=A0A0J7K7G3_LASNI|nr:hypothetical protein RF55_15000 [Lasius niger]
MSKRLIELHLQSSEGENAIVFVSAKDAQRVVNDPKYAKRIANAALGEVTHVPSDTFQSQVASSDNITSNNEEEEEMEADDELESTKEGGTKWSSAATLLLLHEYSEKENLFKSGKRAHRFYWEEIAKVMRSKGYTFSWGQIMEKIFGQRPWVAPLSTPLNNTETPDSPSSLASDTASYTSQGDKKKKSRAEELVDVIYSKIKSDREEHHLKKLEAKKKLHRLSKERKEVQHKEKMAMRAQFLQLLNARLKVIDAAAGTTMNYNQDSTTDD